MKNIPLVTVLLFFFISALFSQQNGAVQLPGEDPARFQERTAFVDNLKSQGVFSSGAMELAFKSVPRDLFLPENMRRLSYQDIAVPSFRGAVIPSYSTLAAIIRYLRPAVNSKILVAGAGAGFAGAVLSRLGGTVFLLETIEENFSPARTSYARAGFTNLIIQRGEDLTFFAQEAPFNCILIHGALQRIPAFILDLLADKGRMVVPVRDQAGMQILLGFEKQGGSFDIINLGTAIFYPLTF